MTTDEAHAVQQEHEMREVLERYRTAPERALQERDDGIRALAVRYDLKQVDVIKLTGYSRETVRRILRPDTRAAVRQARREAEQPAQ